MVSREFKEHIVVSSLSAVTAIDGNYTEWSKWSECSASCGEGQQSRSRECMNPKPQFGGRNCSHIGGSEESRPCTIVNCEGKKVLYLLDLTIASFFSNLEAKIPLSFFLSKY